MASRSASSRARPKSNALKIRDAYASSTLPQRPNTIMLPPGHHPLPSSLPPNPCNGRRGVQVSSVLQETIQGRSRTENQAAADDLKALLQGTSEGSHDESASVPETHMEETAALEGEISEEVQETATLATTSESTTILLATAQSSYAFEKDANPPFEQVTSSVDPSPAVRYARAPASSESTLKLKVEGTDTGLVNFDSMSLSTRYQTPLTSGWLRSRQYQSPPATPQPLLLPGMGGTRSRNQFGKSLAGGQEVVIGMSDGLTNYPRTARGSTVVQGENGYCTPTWHRESEDLDTKPQIQYNQVNLDVDLPPLATEHPARMWNSMMHSLDADVQPIIKWDYGQVDNEDKLKGKMTIAHLTLILPPTHPAVTGHHLYKLLPKNRYSREYIASAEALGALKRWTGEPRKLKADAQNTTLVMCIIDRALDWVLAPVMETVPSEEESDEPSSTHQVHQQAVQTAMDPNTTTTSVCEQVVVSAADNEINAAGIVEEVSGMMDWPVTGVGFTSENTDHHIATGIFTNNADEIVLEDPASASSSPVLPMHTSILPHQGSMGLSKEVSRLSSLSTLCEAIAQVLGPDQVEAAANLGISYDPTAKCFGSHLTIGFNEHAQRYDEGSIHASPEGAIEAVCEKALKLNVLGYLAWTAELRQAETREASPANLASGDRLIASPSDYHPAGVDRYWYSALANLCFIEGQPNPTVSFYRCWNEYGKIMYEGLLEIGARSYRASRPDVTEKQAIDRVTREVCEQWGR